MIVVLFRGADPLFGFLCSSKLVPEEVHMMSAFGGPGEVSNYNSFLIHSKTGMMFY